MASWAAVDGWSGLVDESVCGPSVELPIHRAEGDVTELAGEVTGVPVAVWDSVKEVQDALSASVGGWCVPLVVGDGGQVGLGFKDGDVKTGDREAGVGTAVDLAFGVPGDRRTCLSGADAGTPVREESCQDTVPMTLV
ncbi:hypothetical protein [Streptomyces albipurpureus]|uniref:Uncharacterized protein n=1 Tax=Streptomyces albipurpureus TaxID=2897419 RepID=A0ABT0UX63_9ACTN|nr:hypothetical protein [Streptomyces sp. CWNU-1]MCM2393044.1 hypothetical protein [Streptomyces sp. CWNU-1]